MKWKGDLVPGLAADVKHPETSSVTLHARGREQMMELKLIVSSVAVVMKRLARAGHSSDDPTYDMDILTASLAP
jgi:hypothetical protein